MRRPGLALALHLTGLGWYVALSILLGIWGGLWLDNRLDKAPIFTIVGLILGLVLAFYGAYKMILPLLESDDEVNNQQP